MAYDSAKAIARMRSLTKKFDTRMKATKPWYPRLCTIVPSDGYDEEYGFLGAMPTLREWVGDRVYHELLAGKFAIVNKKWESGVKVKKDDIDDDRDGMYDPVAEQMAVIAACHPDKLLFTDLITNGATKPCFDGQYFYDTDHAVGDSGTQSNKLTYNAQDHTAVTAAEFRAAYHQARRTMLRYKNDRGELLIQTVGVGLSDLVVTVPPELEEVAKVGLTAQLLGGGDTNVVLDRPEIVVVNHLESTVKFQLHYVGGVIKPFVFQARSPLKRWTKGENDPEMEHILFGCDARYSEGYGAWWCSVETTFN